MQVVELKDLSVVTKFLGIASDHNKETGRAVDQENIIEQMLDNFGLAKSTPRRVSVGG